MKRLTALRGVVGDGAEGLGLYSPTHVVRCASAMDRAPIFVLDLAS
jgi:hypothetical protein